jgi:hypothetical protein
LKVLIGILIGIAAVVLVAVIVLGYLGFMPGVSNLFGSNQAKDLGVTFTANDYQSARAKMGTAITDLPTASAPENSISFSGQKAIKATFTEAEFNSLLNKRDWKYYPLKDSQLKINPDGSAEFTAVLIKGRVEDFARAVGASESTLGELTNYLKLLPGDPAIDIKGTCSVVNGKISQSITGFKVGKLDFTKQVQDNSGNIVNWVQSDLFTLPGVSIKNFQLINGKVNFEGTLPDVARSKSK